MAQEYCRILDHNVYRLQTCATRLTNTYRPDMRIKNARQNRLGIYIRQDPPKPARRNLKRYQTLRFYPLR